MVAVWLKFCFFCFSWQNTVRYLNYLRTSLVLTFVEPSAGCTWSKTQSSSRRDDKEAGPQGEGKAPCWIKRRVWPGQSTIVFPPLIYLKEFTLSPYRGMWERQRASLQIWTHTPPRPQPTHQKKEREKIKWSHNKYICQLPFSRSYMSFLKCYAETWKGESDRCHELFQKGASWKASQVWQESGRNSLQSLCGACCFSKKREAGGEKRRRCHTWPHEEVLPFFLVHFANILIFK